MTTRGEIIAKTWKKVPKGEAPKSAGSKRRQKVTKGAGSKRRQLQKAPAAGKTKGGNKGEEGVKNESSKIARLNRPTVWLPDEIANSVGTLERFT